MRSNEFNLSKVGPRVTRAHDKGTQAILGSLSPDLILPMDPRYYGELGTSEGIIIKIHYPAPNLKV